MRKSVVIALITIPTIIIASLIIYYYLPVILMNPSFGRPRTKNIFQIYSDSDFETRKIKGTGTPDNPYIIENRIIGINSTDIKKWYYGLDIANTTKHFVVQNCIFFGGLNAIRIENVTDGTIIIRNNCFYAIAQYQWDVGKGYSGIEIRNTNQVLIENNFFSQANKYLDPFLYLTTYKANNILFDNNTCETGSFSISESWDVLFSNNIFENTDDIRESHYLNFTNNIFKGDLEQFENCSNLFFKNNIFFERLRLFESPNSTIGSNQIYANIGIQLIYSDYVEVLNNTVVFTGEEISTQDTGIYSFSSNNCSFYKNKINNFFYYGMYFTGGSTSNIIFHNSFFDNFGENSISQAYDDYLGNIWYNPIILEGNYWSNLGLNSTYTIDGSAGSIDLYPLLNPVF